MPIVRSPSDTEDEAALGHRGAGDAPGQGVRRARRQAEVEGHEVPADRPDEAGEDHADRQHVGFDDAVAIVAATWVPKIRKATKLKNAAQPSAAMRGDSARVDTTVIELAASWKPLT